MWPVLKDNLFTYLFSIKASQHPVAAFPISQRKNQHSGCEAYTNQQLDARQGFPSAGWLSAEDGKSQSAAKLEKQIEVMSVDFFVVVDMKCLAISKVI